MGGENTAQRSTLVALMARRSAASVVAMVMQVLRSFFGLGPRMQTCPACKAVLPSALMRHGVCSSPLCQEDAALARSSSMGAAPELARVAGMLVPAQGLIQRKPAVLKQQAGAETQNASSSAVHTSALPLLDSAAKAPMIRPPVLSASVVAAKQTGAGR